MPKMRNGSFLSALDDLIKTYPEYSSILTWLKKQIKQGNKERVEAKLKQFKNELF